MPEIGHCSAGHEIDLRTVDSGVVECPSCAMWIGFATNRSPNPPPTSPVIAGLTPIRIDAGLLGSAIYPHGDHELLVWDIAGDGKLSLQCDCGLQPVQLADELGIPRDRLDPDEFRISARMVAEELFEIDPEHPVALATLALLGT